MLLVLLVVSSSADSFLGLDIASLGERDLCKEGTEDLIDKNREEGYALHDLAGRRAEGERLASHTESNTRLGEKSDAEILTGLFVTVSKLGTDACAVILTDRTECDVHKTDKHEDAVGEYGEIELCTADYEEEHEKRCGPLIRSVHEILGEVTDVAEDSTEHHTCKERGKRDMYRSDVELYTGDSNGSHYECNRNSHTLGVGVEVLLTLGKEHAHNCAEHDGKYNLKKRVYNHGYDIHNAGVDRLGNAEGYREDNKTNRVVKSNDGQEEVCERPLRLILLYNHQSCGRSGSGSNCAENDSRREGEHLLTYDEGEHDENDINDNAGEQCLEDTDHGRLASDLLKLGESELITYRKGNKAECEVTEDLVVLGRVVGRVKADAELSEEERADKHTRNKVCSNGGETNLLCQS